MTKIPDDLADRFDTLVSISHTIHKNEILQLHLRLKKLRTEAFNRAVTWRGVGEQYAKTCYCCNGTGQYHYCINPYCSAANDLEKDDCVHFTPDELLTLMKIHADYVKLILEALDVVKTGVNIDGLVNTQPKCPSEVN